MSNLAKKIIKNIRQSILNYSFLI